MDRFDFDDDVSEAAARGAVLTAYSGLMASIDLSPLDALELLAGALGSVYNEIAQAHSWPPVCGCGWTPNGILDVLVLQRALTANCGSSNDDELLDLVTAVPMGQG
jgi:hypothetical protein